MYANLITILKFQIMKTVLSKDLLYGCISISLIQTLTLWIACVAHCSDWKISAIDMMHVSIFEKLKCVKSVC